MPLPLLVARRRRFEYDAPEIPGVDVFAGLPCTDADIAEFSVVDFPAITSGAEYVASGTDGAFAPMSFTMVSSFPFASQGVQVGHVMVLAKNGANLGGDVLAVAEVADGACRLRRLAYPDGLGAFPGKLAGSTGVTYYIPSLVGLIRRETVEARRAIGVITDADLIDPDDLKRLVILRVLRLMYFTTWRSAQPDLFNEKKNDIDKQIAAHLADLEARYGSATPQSHRPVSAMPADLWNWRVPSSGCVDNPSRGWW